MSPDKKNMGKYSTSRVVYHSDGPVAHSKKTRQYKQSFFTCWTLMIAILFAIGIIMLAMKSGIIS